MSQSVFVVDVEQAARVALRDILAGEPDTEVIAHGNVSELGAAKDRPGPALLVWSVGTSVLSDSDLDWLGGPARAGLAVIVLTRGESEADIETILSAGADDVLGKPVRAAALLTRVRRLLRQAPVPGDDTVKLGPYAFDAEQRVLHDPAQDRRIRLTEKEAAILLHLLHADGPVERTVLLHEVWGYSDQVSTHTLETHIYKLRQKIEANPSDARLLLTEAGGYRLARIPL